MQVQDDLTGVTCYISGQFGHRKDHCYKCVSNYKKTGDTGPLK